MFVFALIPFGQIVRVEVLKGIVISPLDVIVLILSVYLLTLLGVGKIKFRFENFHYFLIFFLVIGFVSLLFKLPKLETGEFLSSFGYLLRFVIYIIPLIFLPLFYIRRGQELLMDVVFGGFIFVLFGIAQYLYLPRLELLIFLGEWDIHSFRLFSTFFDPNYAGLFIVIEILLLYGLILMKERCKLYLVMLVISYFSLFLTYSRSSIVALVIGTVAYLLLMKKYRYILFAFILFGISVMSLHIFSKQFGGEGVKVFRTVSIQTRIESYKEGVGVFMQNPFMGSGFNTYKYARRNFGDLNNYDAFSNASNAPSNSFIFVLATTGILGFVSFTLFIIFILKKLINNMQFSKERPIVAGGVAVLFALVTHSIFQNSFFYSPIIIVYVFVIVGVLTYNYSRE